MNDLTTLIAISAGTRLAQYEQEIFSDKELTEYYLRKLCEQCDWYDLADSLSAMGYFYAHGVMKSRWPEAEAVIATDPKWAYCYAHFVMRCRWPVAEAIISTDPEWAYCYAMWLKKSRWPEAEHIIAADPQCSMVYNYHFGTNI